MMETKMKLMITFDKGVVGVIKQGHDVEHFKRGTSRQLARTIFYFKSDDKNKCLTDVTDKRCNLGNGEGMQLSCLLKLV